MRRCGFMGGGLGGVETLAGLSGGEVLAPRGWCVKCLVLFDGVNGREMVRQSAGVGVGEKKKRGSEAFWRC